MTRATEGEATSARSVDVSVVIPAYNEAENLEPVVSELVDVLAAIVPSFEVIVVDDGSTDETGVVLRASEAAQPALRSVGLRRNFGKSAALDAGFASVRGRIVVLMDADGQDDPAALPALLEAVEGGLDLVTGRRALRNDRFVKRTTSRLYNRVTARVTGVPGRDFNSGFKAMTCEVATSLKLYGELHRYIPVLAHWQGFVVGEVDVPHRRRLAGTSKFGGNRFWRGFFDLMGVKFLTSYTTRPLHLFGGLGFLLGFAGALLLAWMLVEQVFFDQQIGGRPALTAGLLLVIIGVQFVSLGLLATLIVHFAERPHPPVREQRRSFESG